MHTPPSRIARRRRQRGRESCDLVEVTSRSTEDYDRGDKLSHYKQLTTLQAVIFVSHRARRITVVERTRTPGTSATFGAAKSYASMPPTSRSQSTTSTTASFSTRAEASAEPRPPWATLLCSGELRAHVRHDLAVRDIAERSENRSRSSASSTGSGGVGGVGARSMTRTAVSPTSTTTPSNARPSLRLKRWRSPRPRSARGESRAAARSNGAAMARSRPSARAPPPRKRARS